MDSASWTFSPHWSTFWGQIQIELIGGVISAFVFLFVLLLLFKPKISVSEFICKPATEDYYLFKIVNVSFFPAHDIDIRLYKSQRVPMSNGKYNSTYERISINNGQIPFISHRAPFWNKKANNPHCITVRTQEDVNQILADPTCGIVLQISLRHGLTGLSKVFEQEYGGPGSVMVGRFTSGTKFEIR